MIKNPKQFQILIVDDTLKNIQVLGALLKKEGYRIAVAQDGMQAIETAKQTVPDLILLDVMMPVLDGFEACRRLKQINEMKSIPIIFLTAKVESEDILKGFELGAVDYITKPLQFPEVVARVETHLTLNSLRKELENTNQILEHRVKERTAELAEANKMMQIEIEERKEAQNRLIQLNDISKHTRDMLNLEIASRIFISKTVAALREDISGSILLYDASKNTLKFYACSGLDPEYVSDFEIVVSPETLYTYEIFTSKKGKIFSYNEFSKFQNEDTTKLHYGRKYIEQMIMPLVSKGQVIGIITVSNYNSECLFTDNEFKLLESISNNISNHFENGLLFEEMINLNQAYERFVPHQFLSLLGKEKIVDLNLGDQTQKRMTILFSDIRSFTLLSEKLTPRENFLFINSYLNQMGPIVRAHNGFIDKFIGDSIMALFEYNSEEAIRSAISMLYKLNEYNEGRERAGYQQIQIGLGVNTGQVIVGTLGENKRMEGTVIGDVVNLASRLEQLTKSYGTPLLISEYTYFDLKNPNEFLIRFIDRVQVKGKTEKVGIYEVFDADCDPIKIKKSENINMFNEAWNLLDQKSYSDAEKLFQECLNHAPEDSVLPVFIDRCQHFQKLEMDQK
ncbi:MAG: response regulator [SAR324 cluster bacterium]|nr:response regulator [SAR324 cluster bacterium]